MGEMKSTNKGKNSCITIDRFYELLGIKIEKEMRKFWESYTNALATKIDKEIMEDLTKTREK